MTRPQPCGTRCSFRSAGAASEGDFHAGLGMASVLGGGMFGGSDTIHLNVNPCRSISAGTDMSKQWL